MKLVLNLIKERGDSTLSELTIEGNDSFFAFVIEDQFLPVKKMHETRIPEGSYKIIPRRFGRHYEKYKKQFNHNFAIELEDVPGFTDILIHIGNTIDHTSGCLLVNHSANFDSLNNRFSGARSTSCYQELYDLIQEEFNAKEIVWIEVNRQPQIEPVQDLHKLPVPEKETEKIPLLLRLIFAFIDFFANRKK